MSKQGFVINIHTKRTPHEKIPGRLADNTKAAWQSSQVTKQTQDNIVATLDTIHKLIAEGKVKDGSIITLHGQVQFTSEAQPSDDTGIVVDDEEVSVENSASAEAADAPF